MADIKSPEERSLNMSRIRGKDTKPEVWFRKALFARGYRYRKNVNKLPGHPDIWLGGYNTAVFVHGCFWHRHPGCRYSYMPKSRIEFWSQKFDRNVERDREVKEQLLAKDIKVITVWECTVKQMMKSEDVKIDVLNKFEKFINKGNGAIEL